MKKFSKKQNKIINTFLNKANSIEILANSPYHKEAFTKIDLNKCDKITRSKAKKITKKLNKTHNYDVLSNRQKLEISRPAIPSVVVGVISVVAISTGGVAVPPIIGIALSLGGAKITSYLYNDCKADNKNKKTAINKELKTKKGKKELISLQKIDQPIIGKKPKRRKIKRRKKNKVMPINISQVKGGIKTSRPKLPIKNAWVELSSIERSKNNQVSRG